MGQIEHHSEKTSPDCRRPPVRASVEDRFDCLTCKYPSDQETPPLWGLCVPDQRFHNPRLQNSYKTEGSDSLINSGNRAR